MVYTGNPDFCLSIDELIAALEKVKKDVGGDCQVVVEGERGGYNGISVVASSYVFDNGSDGFEFAGDPGEDEECGDCTVCTLLTFC